MHTIFFSEQSHTIFLILKKKQKGEWSSFLDSIILQILTCFCISFYSEYALIWSFQKAKKKNESKRWAKFLSWEQGAHQVLVPSSPASYHYVTNANIFLHIIFFSKQSCTIFLILKKKNRKASETPFFIPSYYEY